MASGRSQKRWSSRGWLTTATIIAAEAGIAIAAALAAAHTHDYESVLWAALTLGLVVALTLFRHIGSETPTSDSALIDSGRQAAARMSADTLTEIEASGSGLDRLIPVDVGGHGASVSTADRFGAIIASDLRPGQRWVIEGAPGAGKSTLLHRVALAANNGTGEGMAVVIPLASYDATCERLTDWLVPQIAHIVGADGADVRRLLQQGRVFPLLDGLDTVPSHEILAQQALPASERALFDRILPYHRKAPVDPRERLLAGLDELDSFLISVRSGALSPKELHVLADFNRATLEDIPTDLAADRLRRRAQQLPDLGVGLLSTIGSPLYLRLASNVGASGVFDPPSDAARSEIQAWLWDRTMDIRLAQQGGRDLGWHPDDFRRWLSFCAAAADHEEALGLNRWPLLFRARTREALRVGRSVLSGLIVGGLALALGKPLFASGVAALTGVVFYLAGEGAATRPMAPQRFGVARFLNEARRQWLFAAGFTVAGVLIGVAISEDWFLTLHPTISRPALIVTGTAAGVLLGFTVPTLYELSYIDDASLYSRVNPRSVLWATGASGLVIGGTAGVLAACAIYVAFHSAVALLAIPLCVLLAFLDVLGLPLAAVLLWAALRRGPLRVGRFLALAATVRLVRPIGCYYVFEHGDLQQHLASHSPEPAQKRIRTATWLAAFVSAWLVFYAIHLHATLPAHYKTEHWRALWVGFDLVLAALAALTAYLNVRDSAALAVVSAVLGALIAADAWFDCMTANGSDLRTSLLSLIAEVPASIFFIFLALRATRSRGSPMGRS